ncbi:MAG: hypothetical protein JJ971_14275 [Balneolaceae bacterium]|nr:hypothetical protein [Balneolaceae bacterium]MBO6547568.1 hypothetical protein [Balneolaceae bacterium]MBO6648079.1 hypothetical protein [Balneolaceae bacterium]
MQNFNHRISRDVGDILTDTFQYVRIHYKTLGKGLVFFVFPLYLIQAFLMQGYSDQIFSTLFEPDAIFDFFGWRYFTSIAISLLAYGVLSVVALKHLDLTDQGIDPQPNDLISDSVPLIFRFIGLYILLFLILIASAFFFFFPAVFFGIRLSLAPAALIFENRGVGDAISRSWELTQGYWWATFVLFFIMYIIVIFTTYVFILPATILSIFLMDSGAASEANNYSTLFTVFTSFSAAFGSLFTAILHISFALQFYNLVERKEGGSLRSRIESLVD